MNTKYKCLHGNYSALRALYVILRPPSHIVFFINLFLLCLLSYLLDGSERSKSLPLKACPKHHHFKRPNLKKGSKRKNCRMLDGWTNRRGWIDGLSPPLLSPLSWFAPIPYSIPFPFLHFPALTCAPHPFQPGRAGKGFNPYLNTDGRRGKDARTNKPTECDFI